MIEPGSPADDLPLFRHGDRHAAARRRGQMRRLALAVASLIGALSATIAHPPRPLLVWNASASAPIGLYAVVGKAAIRSGDLVIARTPSAVRDLAARRRYIPTNVPLVKRVAALPGDRVCALGQEILVNGRWIGVRFTDDARGRPMPWWSGCVVLLDGALFLLMEKPVSFDGRYFGPTSARDVVGKAIPLWVR
ncbi:S26 family signal peptidase [Sphingobium sp. YC-XJ3]|jgi:conjugative transfer signal peptidase TraF|uniref:S26 family signal peptidase n=1 Tax=Sphingobium sp. YC-XJ3 TaxID=3024245 RepID=UPI00235F0970|nr:S26 family signal peptidase [Sphingobium sp. YC-XJ3]WDA39320.1 S26 family signal peptidase [Sphingobium sp. YC-XJ3]